MEMAVVLGRLHSLGYPRATMEQRSLFFNVESWLFITISQEFPKTHSLETTVYKHAGHWMDLTLHTNMPRLPKPPWRFMLAQVVFRHDQAWERPWEDKAMPEDSRSRDKAANMKWRWGLQKTGTTSIYGCLLSPSGLCVVWMCVSKINVMLNWHCSEVGVLKGPWGSSGERNEGFIKGASNSASRIISFCLPPCPDEIRLSLPAAGACGLLAPRSGL